MAGQGVLFSCLKPINRGSWAKSWAQGIAVVFGEGKAMDWVQITDSKDSHPNPSPFFSYAFREGREEIIRFTVFLLLYTEARQTVPRQAVQGRSTQTPNTRGRGARGGGGYPARALRSWKHLPISV